MEQLECQLRAADVELGTGVLDRTTRIVAPGGEVADGGNTSFTDALKNPVQRRRTRGRGGRRAEVARFARVLPPTMAILLRGTAAVLGATAAVSGTVGVLCESWLVALNSCGFVGVCALSCAVVFYAVVLERIGLDAASTAATVLVRVLAGAAVVMTAIQIALLRQARFREEASHFGWHSVAGIAVLVVLGAVLATLWWER